MTKQLFYCENCKKAFQEYFSKKKYKRIFCSLSCYFEWKKGKKWEQTRDILKIKLNKKKLVDRWTLEKNPNWNGGVSPETYRRIAFDIYKKPKNCEVCTSTRHLNVHHIDGNYQNISEQNLQILCRACHNLKHGVGKHQHKKRLEVD